LRNYTSAFLCAGSNDYSFLWGIISIFISTNVELLFRILCVVVPCVLHVFDVCYLSFKGKTFQLYTHNLIGLFEQLRKPGLAAQLQTHRFPDRILPRYTHTHTHTVSAQHFTAYLPQFISNIT